MSGDWAFRHHGSHNHLLRRVSVQYAGTGPVDAIIVPTSRPVAYLRHAIRLAQQLDTTLLALCSGKYARPEDVLAEGRAAGARVVAASVDKVRDLPSFRTSHLFAETMFEHRTDTSLKRNIGLAVARQVGWDRVVFLDDDIEVPQAEDLRAVAALLDDHDAAALLNTGFPDNSVVCHAYRAVGGQQESFVGGGAMAVPVDRMTSFFPNIYNEDWFFLLDDVDNRIGRVAATGAMAQRPFDPYVDPRRARSEELGDCLAEGVYALLDTGEGIHLAGQRFWRRFLDDRRQLIVDVLEQLPSQDLLAAQRSMMAECLQAALGRLACVTPDLCIAFLNEWREDRRTWREYFKALPSRYGESAVYICTSFGMKAESTR